MSRETVAVLGTGKAGGALLASLRAARVRVVATASRWPALQRRRAWREADILFVAVPDDAIEDTARALAPALARALARKAAWPSIVVHMSGARGASALRALALENAGGAVGTFHPLASLDGRHAIPRGTFIAIEGSAARAADARRAERKLAALARKMGLVPGVVSETGGDRVRYHAGAVVAGNLATALLHEGIELLVRSGVARDVARVSLARLLASTAANAIARPLEQALTGPVARGDIATIERHLALLDREDAALAALYRTLSRTLVDDVARHDAATKRSLRARLR